MFQIPGQKKGGGGGGSVVDNGSAKTYLSLMFQIRQQRLFLTLAGKGGVLMWTMNLLFTFNIILLAVGGGWRESSIIGLRRCNSRAGANEILMLGV